MARNALIEITAHDGTHCASGFRITRFRSDLFIRHRFPFRDLFDDRFYFLAEGSHSPNVPSLGNAFDEVLLVVLLIRD